MDNDDTGDTPILSTRIPAARRVTGLQYGAHVAKYGWDGYYVSLDGEQWGIARLTPASDELEDGDEAIVAAIHAELGS